MKLTLKNFRCYTIQTFEFNDDTMTLISGPSGRGKTTILIGIQFALYGTTNHKYLISHNKTNCEVILEYKNFKVKRTKRPNILNVEFDGRKYEDKEAQIVLNKYFGIANSSIFFLDLSHFEKMEFLEKIVNTDCDVKELKLRIKDEISNLNKEVAILNGQISNTESMLEIIQKPEKVDKPNISIYFKEEDNLSSLTKKELQIKYDETIKDINYNKIKLEKFNSLMVEIDVLTKEIDSMDYLDPNLLSIIEDNKKKLVELKGRDRLYNILKEKFLIAEENKKELQKYNEYKEEDLHNLKEKIKILDVQIKKCLSLMDVHTFKKLELEYKELLNQEKTEWQQKIDLIQNQINNLNIEKDGDLLSIKELEQILFKFEDVQTFNKNYNLFKIEDEIQSLKSKFFKSYICHNCNHKLIVNMDTFEQIYEDIEVETSNKKQDITTLKSKIQKQEILKDKIKHNEEYIKSINIDKIKEQIDHIKHITQLNMDLKKLGLFKPSTYLFQLEKKVLSLKLSLPSTLDLNEEEIMDINTLKDEKRDFVVQYNHLSDKLKIKAKLAKKSQTSEHYNFEDHEIIKYQIEECDDALKHQISNEQSLKNKVRFTNKLILLKKELNDLNFDISVVSKLENLLNQINLGLQYHEKFEKYRSFQFQLHKYKKIKGSLLTFKETKKNMEQTYLKTLIFKQKVIEAEHESLEFMISIINSHLSILLQDFFSENFGDPIQIYLELVNDTRPQVNTIINYKGNRVDYKSLSTGEYARVKLAFDLTFKEILGENIVMLDECTANLDQDLSTKIFKKIRDSFPSKTILVVAHQVVMGTFDNVISL